MIKSTQSGPLPSAVLDGWLHIDRIPIDEIEYPNSQRDVKSAHVNRLYMRWDEHAGGRLTTERNPERFTRDLFDAAGMLDKRHLTGCEICAGPNNL